MTYYLVLFAAFFLVAFSIRYFRAAFYALSKNSLGLVDELLAQHLDEDEKIRKIQQKTNRLTLSLLRMFLIILLAFGLGSLPIIAYAWMAKVPYAELDFSSLYAILSLSLGATLPFILPWNKKSNNTYSELSQLLHHLALDNYWVSDKLFRRETRMISKKGWQRREDFVIVTGLARSGTTSLMNDLAKVDHFVSLSYANMPFLMAPNTWARLYTPKTKKLEERSHKDGIMIGLNSNEALEEYFFKVKARDAYIHPHQLVEYTVSENDYEAYLDYQSLIRKDNRMIYLAKNNNFLLRYRSLRAYNENFLMVILFRDPLTHAASLLEKHRYYQELQLEDPFVLQYMDWLGHHEFGLHQKAFHFEANAKKLPEDKMHLDYWLQSWINYYAYVLTIDHPNTMLVHYDAYCKHPGEIVGSILEKMGIQREVPGYTAFNNKRKNVEDYSEALYEEAFVLYQKLIKKVD